MTTSTTIETSTSTSYRVLSVPPAKLADTEMVIAWSRRSTDKNPVSAEERFRGIVLPKSVLALPHEACSSKFYNLLQITLWNLADGMFTSWVRDNMLNTDYEVHRMTIDNVLAFWAEERQRNTIDAAKIVEFLKQSKTLAGFAPALQAVWLNKLPKIAAPSYKQTFSREQAAAIVSKLHEDDLDNEVCLFIMQRANNVISAETVQEAL